MRHRNEMTEKQNEKTNYRAWPCKKDSREDYQDTFTVREKHDNTKVVRNNTIWRRKHYWKQTLLT